MQHSTMPQAVNPKDAEENKIIAALGYLGFLCLLPLLLKKDSPFAQHHGKQGLVLLIAWLILWLVNVVPFVGQVLWVLGSIGILILVLLGIVNALNGNMWEMPVLGKYAKDIKL
ncbi:MAG: hypothetical protein UX57_C0028G0004 [Candidatus Uhrbacteria bacterium GW2011_GWE2_46_68]|uniref:Chloroplast import component protein (Tic20) n=2 Tax=Candidatus Uhriibacteriota TaxID=1752732 RepID=A0A0G1Q4R8_9BACT|nr:MAG: hypothetical protein UX45_C0043G0003 [Candidatus Uhrbacteria bacterium GW2011_GWF2_46_218]KKU40026.1 MAG: hypothetical protein UX57_C0028G0004 [Candidatus Uhrbacteria bacterium GW2011_GWE2_46_68]